MTKLNKYFEMQEMELRAALMLAAAHTVSIAISAELKNEVEARKRIEAEVENIISITMNKKTITER